MKTIIAGSRSITDYDAVKAAIIESGFHITVVLCGMAAGPDSLGEEWAKENKVNVKYFPADWEKYGRKAGPLRNIQMAEDGEALIAIHDGQSSGTKHMISEARKRGLKVFVKIIPPKQIPKEHSIEDLF